MLPAVLGSLTMALARSGTITPELLTLQVLRMWKNPQVPPTLARLLQFLQRVPVKIIPRLSSNLIKELDFFHLAPSLMYSLSHSLSRPLSIDQRC